MKFVVNKLGMKSPGFDRAFLKKFVNKYKYTQLKGVAPTPKFGNGSWTVEERTRAVTTHNNQSRKASPSASIADEADENDEFNEDDEVIYDSSGDEEEDDY